ncbi:hypothetical protein ACP70R_023184 [Stipagrostis hirtigluma subsp. patula]
MRIDLRSLDLALAGAGFHPAGLAPAVQHTPPSTGRAPAHGPWQRDTVCGSPATATSPVATLLSFDLTLSSIQAGSSELWLPGKKEMDKSWIRCRLFSKPYLDGVNDFMKFVSERFGENEKIHGPCRRCLNQIYGHKRVLEDHLYIHGISSTYDRWIYYGEPLDAGMNENAVQLDEHVGLNEDVHLNKDEEDPEDTFPDMVQEL